MGRAKRRLVQKPWFFAGLEKKCQNSIDSFGNFLHSDRQDYMPFFQLVVIVVNSVVSAVDNSEERSLS